MSDAVGSLLEVLNQVRHFIQKDSSVDAYDLIAVQSEGTEAGCRMGVVERAEHSEAKELGVRVLKGKRQAFVSTSDLRLEALKI